MKPVSDIYFSNSLRHGTLLIPTRFSGAWHQKACYAFGFGSLNLLQPVVVKGSEIKMTVRVDHGLSNATALGHESLG